MINFGVDFGTPSKTTFDEFWALFGNPFSPKMDPSWAKRRPESLEKLQESKKEPLGKVLFSYAKTIVSELRARENALKIEQKAPQSHHKTVWEQEKDEIEKRTAFRLVLDEFWRSFETQNGAKKSPKRRSKFNPKTRRFSTTNFRANGGGFFRADEPRGPH